MALLNNCDDVWYQSLPACTTGFTVTSEQFEQNTDYYWIITDKFGHLYSDVAETDEFKTFEIPASAFPIGFFNEYAGQMILEVKGHPYYCEPIGMEICGAVYNRIVIDFKKGDLPAKIPCLCP